MSRKTAKLTKHNPTTALSYIRLSWKRDAKDTERPDRQRSNILRVCEQNGWLPEFYEDAEGHKSGTTEKNRPGWLALKSRLADLDVAALVANDLSRLHRKGWRIGDLLDFVDEHEVKLVLYKVGKARYDRTLARTIDDGHFRGIHPYPLLGLVYCHHCDVLAKIAKDPRRRTRLGGKNKTQDGRYRHKHGVKCGCTNRSIKRDILEVDFGRLLELLCVNPEQIEAITLLNLRALGGKHSVQFNEALEAEKRAAIAKCTRRIDATRHLFEDGDISREEYVRRKKLNEREIAHWNARTTETDRVALELTLCQEAIARVGQMWNSGNDDDKQGLVRSLFEEIVLNLDTQRITSFKLKPRADNFISLRAALYQDEGQGGGNKTALESNQGLGKAVTPTASGRKTEYDKLLDAKRRILAAIHIRFHRILSGNHERNLVLKARYLAGETLSALAREFILTPQRDFQIVQSSN